MLTGVVGRDCHGRAMLVVKWNDGEMSSADVGHAGEKINKRNNQEEMQLTYPQGKRRKSLQRMGG